MYILYSHTHVGFYGLWGLSIGVMVFILYKLYELLPYTYPTPKLSPHRRRCISTFPQKNLLCMIYKHFELWGHWKCPHKSPSPCNTHVIIQICVLINRARARTHARTHARTRTHTHTHTTVGCVQYVHSMYIEHCCSVGMFGAKFLCIFDTFKKHIKLFILFGWICLSGSQS